MRDWLTGKGFSNGLTQADIEYLFATHSSARDIGYRDGVAAAREAVAALFPQERYPDEHAAILAAIDGVLKGE